MTGVVVSNKSAMAFGIQLAESDGLDQLPFLLAESRAEPLSETADLVPRQFSLQNHCSIVICVTAAHNSIQSRGQVCIQTARACGGHDVRPAGSDGTHSAWGSRAGAVRVLAIGAGTSALG